MHKIITAAAEIDVDTSFMYDLSCITISDPIRKPSYIHVPSPLHCKFLNMLGLSIDRIFSQNNVDMVSGINYSNQEWRKTLVSKNRVTLA
jgi:hypothetical protein